MTDADSYNQANGAIQGLTASEEEILAELFQLLQHSEQTQSEQTQSAPIQAASPVDRNRFQTATAELGNLNSKGEAASTTSSKASSKSNSLNEHHCNDRSIQTASVQGEKTNGLTSNGLTSNDLTSEAEALATVLVEANPDLAGDEALAELRRLLMSSDQLDFKQLKERLENLELRAVDVGQVLPQAVLLQSNEADQLNHFAEAMLPTVERSVRESVRRDENVLADAIFPIVGPAARKAIASALESSIQSLDHVLEQSLSPRALLWRIEAARTGRSFGEIVMLRSLLFRVEQIFLIHRSSGLVLQHLMAESVTAQDPDLVSAMLQAIQDFVADSFTLQPGDRLETLQFGELTIWIEQGPQAVLAGVIRGQAPLEFRAVFQHAIEQIHQKFHELLTLFQGDSAPFAATRPYLEPCLQTGYKTPPKKGSPYSKALFILLLLGASLWGYREVQARLHWAAYVRELRAAPGIVVNAAEKRWGGFAITGLRDPLAIDPNTLLSRNHIDPARVTSQWEPYLSLHPKLLEVRARQILKPPATASFYVDPQGALHIRGEASYQWVQNARRQVQTIPGITSFREELTLTELKTLAASKTRIEQAVLRFEPGTAELVGGQNDVLQNLVKNLNVVTNITSLLRMQVRIEVIGRASQDGTAAQNLALSQDRANTIQSQLVAGGIPSTALVAIGIGSQNPLVNPQIPTDALNRSATVKVFITNTASEGESNQAQSNSRMEHP